MYHMVSIPRSRHEIRYACPPKLFAKHMHFLRDKRYNIINLENILTYLTKKRPIPDRTIAVTMDDGFQDNFHNAFPILKKHRIPATIFLTAGKIGKTNEWMTARGLLEKKMLGWEQIRKMSDNGISFGSHTITHPRLPELLNENAIEEIGQSKKIIENKIGKTVHSFAYPYGLYSNESIDIVRKCNYQIACSTRSGFNNFETNPFLMRRIEIYGNDPLWKFSQKLTFGMNDASVVFPCKYYYSRLMHRLFNHQ